jgi:hypothetical protein
MAKVKRIKWPGWTKHSEFEIQAALLGELLGVGLLARGEVVGCKTTRLDLVVFDYQLRPQLVIECKTDKLDKLEARVGRRRNHKAVVEFERERERQNSYQETHNVPVMLVRGMAEVAPAICEIERRYPELWAQRGVAPEPEFTI